MDDQHALVIVSALANGTHPSTGEIFSVDSPYQAPDIIRAMFAAQRALEARSTSAAQRPQLGARASSSGATGNTNAGKAWSADEDKQLLAAFDSGKTLAEIAGLHGRTVNGVRARLEKHGRLEPSTATRWPQTREHSDRSNRARSASSANSPP